MSRKTTYIKDRYGKTIRENDIVLCNVGKSVGQRKLISRCDWQWDQVQGTVKFRNESFWLVRAQYSPNCLQMSFGDDISLHRLVQRKPHEFVILGQEKEATQKTSSSPAKKTIRNKANAGRTT